MLAGAALPRCLFQKAGGGNVVSTVSKMLFRASGAAAPTPARWLLVGK